MGCRFSILKCLQNKYGLSEKESYDSSCEESGSLTGLSDSTGVENGNKTQTTVNAQAKDDNKSITIRKTSLEDYRAGNPLLENALDKAEDTEDSLVEDETKGPQDVEPNLLTSDVPGPTKILLVFGKDDRQMEILSGASRRLGWAVSIVESAERALELFQNRRHDIVIVDRRANRASDADSICTALRQCGAHPHAVIIALVKKSHVMRSEDIVALELLDVGFTNMLMECSHSGILTNQLIGIYNGSMMPRRKLAAAHTLYVALDSCRDMVHVTDTKYTIQFVNKVTEKLTGYKSTEIVGLNLMEIISCENFALMEQQLSRGTKFEGNVHCKRKNEQTITISCRMIPFSVTSKKPSHYIYVYDTMYLSENSGVIPYSPSTIMSTQKPSILYGRRSSEAKSLGEGRRRSSLQKLHSLQLEAPITKVITLLSTAITDAMDPETIAQIDKAIEMLKTTELYAAHLRENNVLADPVATDLVGALLASPRVAWESRRSSADSARLSFAKSVIGGTSASRAQPKGFRGSQDLANLLDKCLQWDFNIFKLEVLTDSRPLLYLGMTLMNLYQAPTKLGCDEKTMENWLSLIEQNYRSNNSYHNSTHAADVLQATASFMQSDRLKDILDPLDEIAALIAAAAHDIDHPGRSSQFLCNADNKLAILYNDLSVLESHHAALTFKLSLSDDRVNIFKNLDRETYKLIRRTIIDMILATEMTKHFEHLAKFMNVCSARVENNFIEDTDSLSTSTLLQPDNIILVKRMMIKCADVSNPTRPLKCCVEWARRIAEEYFSQNDEEKQLKLPVLMPMFDRETCSIPKSQIGFVDYIIHDMIEAWDAFINMPEMVGYMRQNYEKWKEYNEQNVTTLQDIERIQQLPELRLP